jgi:hypothetical protein
VDGRNSAAEANAFFQQVSIDIWQSRHRSGDFAAKQKHQLLDTFAPMI